MGLFSSPAVIPAKVVDPVTIEFGGSQVDAVARTTYTFTSVGIGTAAAGRKVVVAAANARATTTSAVSSMTIAGVSATKVVAANHDPDDTADTELWQAVVATGTTATIVVTYDLATDRCGVGTWAVYGAASAAHATATNFSDPLSASINVPEKGGCIGSVGSANVVLTYTWTNLTENYDEVVQEGVIHSGASETFATTQTGLTITANGSSTPSRRAMALASWGPA